MAAPLRAQKSCAASKQRSSFARSRHVRVEEQGGYEGVTEGLDERGFLLVRTANGLRTLLSGTVRAVEPTRWKMSSCFWSWMSAIPTRCWAFSSETATMTARAYARLMAHWRVSTNKTQTVDEYGVLFRNLFRDERAGGRVGARAS